MLSKTINFLKYNNATVLIILAFFVVGSGVFAQTETGQALIGEEQTNVEGIDNTVLLAVDLAGYDMDFKIEKIEEDAKYYYVTYTFLDIDIIDNAWQYDLKEKTRKISKRSGEDIAVYMAEEFGEIYDARIDELRTEQDKAKNTGEEKRVAVTAYSGLIGQTLDLASRFFPGYEPVKTAELPSPDNFALPVKEEENNTIIDPADDLADIYQEYMDEHDQDVDGVLDALDICPAVSNPDQADVDENGIGDACETATPPADTAQPSDSEPVPAEASGANEPVLPKLETIIEPESVEIIDLPESASETPAAEPSALEPAF